MKPYPEYKESGVEWLGSLPVSWEVRRIGQCFTPRIGKVSDKDYPALSVTKNGIMPQLETAAKTDAGDSRKRVEPGDFVINSRSDRKGSAGVSKLRGSVSLISIVITPQSIEPNYAHELLRSIPFQEEFYRYGKGIVADLWSTNYSEMKNILIPLPPLPEQRAIAAFLDRETAKIDTLIAKQEQLIALLEEKRQALISHAVTKGLDPNVKMKDSGVEWLGKVPDHWGIKRFGQISSIVRGGSPRPAGSPELFNGDFMPWVTVAEITKDDEIYLTGTETFLTKLGSTQSRIFRQGTLLLSNSGATLGVPKILKIDANANDGVVGFEKLSEHFNILFCYFFLLSLTDNLRERTKQGSGQPNLNTDIVKGISVPQPPRDEQDEIVKVLQINLDKLAAIKQRAKSGIELLKEKRSALISAAVTGKIDVRDKVPM